MSCATTISTSLPVSSAQALAASVTALVSASPLERDQHVERDRLAAAVIAGRTCVGAAGGLVVLEAAAATAGGEGDGCHRRDPEDGEPLRT